MKEIKNDTAKERPVHAGELEWVGMRDLCVPLNIKLGTVTKEVDSSISIAVNLPSNSSRGIHMSRLQRLLDQYTQKIQFPIDNFRDLLDELLESQTECKSTASMVSIEFSIIKRSSALLTAGIGGSSRYPCHFQCQKEAELYSFSLSLDVTYSSTCPCSASLVREALSDDFLNYFSNEKKLDPIQVRDWLLKNGTNFTPHSQRSTARIILRWKNNMPPLDLLEIIGSIEDSLGTPTQTAVKRQDELEFARLNGSNLMYVEDAARRLKTSLRENQFSKDVSVDVTHFESLHPHNAFAIS